MASVMMMHDALSGSFAAAGRARPKGNDGGDDDGSGSDNNNNRGGRRGNDHSWDPTYVPVEDYTSDEDDDDDDDEDDSGDDDDDDDDNDNDDGREMNREGLGRGKQSHAAGEGAGGGRTLAGVMRALRAKNVLSRALAAQSQPPPRRREGPQPLAGQLLGSEYQRAMDEANARPREEQIVFYRKPGLSSSSDPNEPKKTREPGARAVRQLEEYHRSKLAEEARDEAVRAQHLRALSAALKQKALEDKIKQEAPARDAKAKRRAEKRRMVLQEISVASESGRRAARDRIERLREWSRYFSRNLGQKKGIRLNPGGLDAVARGLIPRRLAPEDQATLMELLMTSPHHSRPVTGEGGGARDRPRAQEEGEKARSWGVSSLPTHRSSSSSALVSRGASPYLAGRLGPPPPPAPASSFGAAPSYAAEAAPEARLMMMMSAPAAAAAAAEEGRSRASEQEAAASRGSVRGGGGGGDEPSSYARLVLPQPPRDPRLHFSSSAAAAATLPHAVSRAPRPPTPDVALSLAGGGAEAGQRGGGSGGNGSRKAGSTQRGAPKTYADRVRAHPLYADMLALLQSENTRGLDLRVLKDRAYAAADEQVKREQVQKAIRDSRNFGKANQARLAYDLSKKEQKDRRRKEDDDDDQGDLGARRGP